MGFKRVAVPRLPKGSQTDQETGCSSSVETDREMRMLHLGQTASGVGSESSARLRDNKQRHRGGGFNSRPVAPCCDWSSEGKKRGEGLGERRKHAGKQAFDHRVKNYQLSVRCCWAPNSKASREIILFK